MPIKRIASAKAKFISRGENSGNHKKEMHIWKMADITPEWDWYVVTKDFMAATLKRENAEKGDFMTDSSTWTAKRKNMPDLEILFRWDKFRVNTYHTLAQLSGATAGTAIEEKFIEFVVSEEGQEPIRELGKEQYGEGLYNDAAYAKKYDH